MLIEAGAPHPYVYFVDQGVIAMTHSCEPNGPRILDLADESRLVGCFTALAPQGLVRVESIGVGSQPRHKIPVALGMSHIAAYAITRSHLTQLDFRVIDAMARQHLAWAQMLLTFYATYIRQVEHEVHEMRVLSAEERYRMLLDVNPSLVARVKQRHLASYLGITEVGMSRIIKRVASEGRTREGLGGETDSKLGHGPAGRPRGEAFASENLPA